MRGRIAALLLLIPATALAAGCGALADAPPGASPEDVAPTLVTESPAARSVTSMTVPTLDQDGFDRRANRLTMRIRNLSCEGVSTGSGWALDAHTLVTNRHVVAGAERLEVETGDGHSLTVSAAQAGVLGDLAYVEVKDELPVVARTDAAVAPGEEVAAVGYPLGGPFTITRGVVVDAVDGTSFDVPGTVLRITAEVRPGNSGGPLLDSRGRVVGIVYAIENATGLGLAMPMKTVDTLITDGGFEAVPACGSN